VSLTVPTVSGFCSAA